MVILQHQPLLSDVPAMVKITAKRKVKAGRRKTTIRMFPPDTLAIWESPKLGRGPGHGANSQSEVVTWQTR